MGELPLALVAAGLLAAWVGHACLVMATINHLYGRPIHRLILKPVRHVAGVVILAGPLLLLSGVQFTQSTGPEPRDGVWGQVVYWYALVCAAWAVTVFPAITLYRLLRKRPAAVVAEASNVVDLRAEIGDAIAGDGKNRFLTRFPGNESFLCDFATLTLELPRLPAAWDGLTILHVSDLHFFGTPAPAFFERAFDGAMADGVPDLVCVTGDFVDSVKHHRWIRPLMRRLSWKVAGLAVIGNHDKWHRPDSVRRRLAASGYRVLSGRVESLTVRGVPLTVAGHEGPWFGPPPDLSTASDAFRLLLTHSPDTFRWSRRNRVDLALAGHVHGGAVRVPVVGSIFVPSQYGRRYDMGVFEADGTVMSVSRGLGGKEPLRYNCPPQITRITLKPASRRT